jgi:hypothetical protein
MDESDSAAGSRVLTMGTDTDGTTEPETITFAEWRAQRPFWPGLVMILGGLAIAWPALQFVLTASLVESRSIVTLGIPLGALVVFAGIGATLRPERSNGLGLAGICLSTLSFVIVFGGVFFLGLILGGAGGVLAFAWEPPVGTTLSETAEENEAEN